MVRKRPITEKMLVEPTAKKVRQSSRYQDCPVPRCGAVTNYMKDHVQSAHMPSQLEPEDRALGNTHRQRLRLSCDGVSMTLELCCLLVGC